MKPVSPKKSYQLIFFALIIKYLSNNSDKFEEISVCDKHYDFSYAVMRKNLKPDFRGYYLLHYIQILSGNVRAQDQSILGKGLSCYQIQFYLYINPFAYTKE